MMRIKTNTSWIAVVCLTISILSALSPGATPQHNNRPRSLAAGTNILWEEPVDIEQRDLFYGSGGQQGAPDPSGKFTFIRRSTSGTQKKIIVKDDRGREWTVKFGPEAKPETAASRIVWAAGYQVDQNYFVEQARIEGYETPVVRNVRFERNDDNFKEAGNWSWESNPFVGTRELDGLKVLVALLKNWDLKTANNKIALRGSTDGGSPPGRVYYISDLGATLGATGSFLNGFPFLSDLPPDRPVSLGSKKGKGHAEAFSREDFIKEVRDGEVVFNHERKRGKRVLKGITVENARWMGNLLARLSDKQLSDAFRAGGFNDSETAVYVRTMRERIRELQELN
jgi:hypothetical protein